MKNRLALGNIRLHLVTLQSSLSHILLVNVSSCMLTTMGPTASFFTFTVFLCLTSSSCIA